PSASAATRRSGLAAACRPARVQLAVPYALSPTTFPKGCATAIGNATSTFWEGDSRQRAAAVDRNDRPSGERQQRGGRDDRVRDILCLRDPAERCLAPLLLDQLRGHAQRILALDPARRHRHDADLR